MLHLIDELQHNHNEYSWQKKKLLRGIGGRITGADDNKRIMPGCISVPNQDRCILLHNYK